MRCRIWCLNKETNHFLTPHQLLDFAVPAEHFSKLPHRVCQVAQLHMISSPQWDPLKGADGVSIQQEARNSGAHRIYQTGKRLDLEK